MDRFKLSKIGEKQYTVEISSDGDFFTRYSAAMQESSIFTTASEGFKITLSAEHTFLLTTANPLQLDEKMKPQVVGAPLDFASKILTMLKKLHDNNWILGEYDAIYEDSKGNMYCMDLTRAKKLTQSATYPFFGSSNAPSSFDGENFKAKVFTIDQLKWLDGRGVLKYFGFLLPQLPKELKMPPGFLIRGFDDLNVKLVNPDDVPPPYKSDQKQEEANRQKARKESQGQQEASQAIQQAAIQREAIQQASQPAASQQSRPKHYSSQKGPGYICTNAINGDTSDQCITQTCEGGTSVRTNVVVMVVEDDVDVIRCLDIAEVIENSPAYNVQNSIIVQENLMKRYEQLFDERVQNLLQHITQFIKISADKLQQTPPVLETEHSTSQTRRQCSFKYRNYVVVTVDGLYGLTWGKMIQKNKEPKEFVTMLPVMLLANFIHEHDFEQTQDKAGENCSIIDEGIRRYLVIGDTNEKVERVVLPHGFMHLKETLPGRKKEQSRS